MRSHRNVTNSSVDGFSADDMPDVESFAGTKFCPDCECYTYKVRKNKPKLCTNCGRVSTGKKGKYIANFGNGVGIVWNGRVERDLDRLRDGPRP